MIESKLQAKEIRMNTIHTNQVSEEERYDLYNIGCLNKKRAILEHLVKNEYLEKGDFSTDLDSGYPLFLEYAAELSTAIALKQWENADEIAYTLIEHRLFKGKEEYAIIILKLLEDVEELESYA